MPLTGRGLGGIRRHENLIVPLTFFFGGTINSIALRNLFPEFCTMAFLAFIMNGLRVREVLKQSLHYLTNVFNWTRRGERVSRRRATSMYCLIIRYCKWDCFGQSTIINALLCSVSACNRLMFGFWPLTRHPLFLPFSDFQHLV